MSLTTLVRRSRRGSASVEFALTLPILIGLALGIVEYGWLFHEYNLLHTAMRDAARAGSKAGPTDAVTAATTRLGENLNFYGLCPNGCGNPTVALNATNMPTDTLFISVTMPYQPITGFPAPGLPQQVSGQIVFAVEP